MANWLAKWDPFKDLEDIHDAFDRFFGRELARPTRATELRRWVPTIDVIDEKDTVVVKAEIPGVDKKDINISLNEDTLTINGETKKEEEVKEENYYRAERYYGSFSRTIELPTAVEKDKVKATYKDGILTVTLPKTKEAKPKVADVP